MLAEKPTSRRKLIIYIVYSIYYNGPARARNLINDEHNTMLIVYVICGSACQKGSSSATAVPQRAWMCRRAEINLGHQARLRRPFAMSNAYVYDHQAHNEQVIACAVHITRNVINNSNAIDILFIHSYNFHFIVFSPNFQMPRPYKSLVHRIWIWRRARTRWCSVALRMQIHRPALFGAGPAARKLPAYK